MRAARALLDAFGIGAPLVAVVSGGVLCVSVLVGEHGWPGAASPPGGLTSPPAGTAGLMAGAATTRPGVDMPAGVAGAARPTSRHQHHGASARRRSSAPRHSN